MRLLSRLRLLAPPLGALLWLALFADVSCGGDESKQSECEQLQSSLCDRTTECAVAAGMTSSSAQQGFKQRCLSALTNQLTCSVPADGSGDFELCTGAMREIPCDVVVMYLDSHQVVAPASSCGDYFGL